MKPLVIKGLGHRVNLGIFFLMEHKLMLICKTKLFQSEVEYLEHRISKGGVSMIPEYMQKIKDWPVLKSGKEVATFLGYAGYYHTFIPQYSVLTS